MRFWMSLTGDQPLEHAVRVDDRQLLDPVAVQQARSASSSVVPTDAVTRPSDVITAETRCETSFSKRRSRFVRIPTSRPPSSVIGTPDTW